MMKHSLPVLSRRPQAGQGLTEYSLIGVLVVVASIGALAALGDMLGGSLNALKADMLASQTPPAAMGSGTAEGIGNSGTPSGSAAAEGSTPSSGVDPSTMYLPSNIRDLTKSVETAGANGTTGMLASRLDVLAQQMLASGEITETEANMLSSLSRQGHRIAQIEKLLEDAIANSPTSKAYASTKLQFEGKTYTTTELGDSIGWPSGRSATEWSDPLSPSSTAPETKAFLQLYQQVAQSGMLSNNPQAAEEVRYLSSQISYMTDVVASSSFSILNNDISPKEFGAQSQYYLKNNPTISKMTHQYSGRICEIGTGETSNCAS